MGWRSSSAVAVTGRGSRSSVSMTHRSPPAMKAISRPSAVNAASLACRKTRRSTRSFTGSLSWRMSVFRGGSSFPGWLQLQSKKWRENEGGTIAGNTRKRDRVVGEAGELSALTGGEIVLPQVEGAAACADVIKPFAVRLPQRPAATCILVEDAVEVLAVEFVQPDLAG